MESIKELRVQLQTNVLGHPILQRVLSIYLTRPLLSTSVTPNQVTAFMVLVGILASVAVFFGWFLLGLGLMYFSVLLDAVDGEVARYKRLYSLRGIYLDFVSHLLTGPLFLIAVTFFVAVSPEHISVPVLVAGVVGGLAKSVRRASGDLPRVLFVRYYSDLESRLGPVPAVSEAEVLPLHTSVSGLSRIARRVAEAVYDLHELAPMILVLLFAHLADLFIVPQWPVHTLVKAVVLFYGVTACVYLVREIIGGFNAVESRITAIRSRLASK